MNRRTPCAIPFCKRGTTRLEPGYEFLCANHWPLVPARLKSLRRRFRAKNKRELEAAMRTLKKSETGKGITHDQMCPKWQKAYSAHQAVLLQSYTFERAIWRKMKAAIMP